MYWRKPLAAGEADPVVNILGPVYPILQNKYYIDEFYARAFVQPLQWFSKNVAYEFLDKGVIDGTLHLIARVFTWVGNLLKYLNLWLIDGVGDGIPILIAKFGGWIRWVQSGRVQQYLLLITIATLLIALVFALSTGVLQASP